MSAITKNYLQMGPFRLPLAAWQSDLLDLFCQHAKAEGETVLRIEKKPFGNEPGELTLIVPLNKPQPTEAAVSAAGE